MIALGVAVFGGLGAGARFMLDGFLTERVHGPVPLATLIINTLGSLLLGVLTGWIAVGGPVDVKTIAGVGFCGGFTTFSTASVELVRLVRDDRRWTALGLAAGMLGLSLAAAAAGLWLGSR